MADIDTVKETSLSNRGEILWSLISSIEVKAVESACALALENMDQYISDEVEPLASSRRFTAMVGPTLRAFPHRLDDLDSFKWSLADVRVLEQALAHSEEAHGVKQSVPGLRGLLHAAKSAIKIDGSQQLSIQDPLYSIFASDIDRTAVQADRDRHSDGGDSAHVVTRDVLAQKQTLLVWWQHSGDDIMKGTYRTIDDDRIWIPAMSKWTQGLYDQRSNYSVEDDGEQTDLPAVESMLSVLDYYINNFEGLTINSLPGVKPLVRPSMLPAERVAYVSQVIVDSREENNKQEDMIWLNQFGADVFEKNGSDLLSYCKRGDENILSHGARAESIGERVRTAYFEVHAAAMDESLDEDRFHGIRVAGVHGEILSQLGGLINLYNKAKSTSAPSSPELTFRRLE